MKKLARKIGQFLGLIYRDDGSWRMGYQNSSEESQKSPKKVD
jgi:hypothetical protein